MTQRTAFAVGDRVIYVKSWGGSSMFVYDAIVKRSDTTLTLADYRVGYTLGKRVNLDDAGIYVFLYSAARMDLLRGAEANLGDLAKKMRAIFEEAIKEASR